MKLTWFGNTAFRFHIGGQIVVVDVETAPPAVDRTELRSGADVEIVLAEEREHLDGNTWRPRLPERLLDAGETTRPAQTFSLGKGSLLVDADEDVPLILLTGDVPSLGRWAEKAVVLLAGPAVSKRALAVLDARPPRLLALAAGDAELDAAFAVLRDRLDGTGVVALEPGLAVEV